MSEKQCWICESPRLTLVRNSTLPDRIDSTAFRITDSDYGRTADIYRCAQCGFLQCSDFTDVLQYYADMEDGGYEDTRDERGLQARKLLESIAATRRLPGQRLLDVGAGSGILIEEALKLGVQAEGIEPSATLQHTAVARDLPVRHGVLPHDDVKGPFDIVTLIDVIEHVPNPVQLLDRMREVMAPDGIGVVVTPDVGSIAAKVMQRKWWHYRIAHIGYFDRGSLNAAVAAARMSPLAFERPSWFFPADYLAERLFTYLPRMLRPPVPKIFNSITVPLNLFDSMMVIFTRD